MYKMIGIQVIMVYYNAYNTVFLQNFKMQFK